MPIPSSITPRRRKALAAAASLVVATFAFGAVGPVGAAPSAQSNAAATWLAGRVGADGAVISPSSGQPSAGATVQVALGLVANQSDTAAIGRAMAYIGSHVDAYVVQGGTDNAGALGNLLQLAASTHADPHSFGSGGVDLVARLGALLGAAEPGLYGSADPFSATFNQSLAIIGLVATGQPVPAGAIGWLTDQQCGAGTNSAGGWQSYRASTGGVPNPCVASDATTFSGADSNSTAVAIQALVAAGTNGPVAGGLAFLALTQTSTAPVGGFAFYVGADADPNSTALGIQALVAAGQSPTGASWTVAGGNPLTSLTSWQLKTGADAGALASPFSAGAADFVATTQGVWGLAEQAFPFPQLPATPTTSTTSTTVPAVEPVAVAPAFTG